jgi:2-haloacid dehalogenase
VPRILVFDVIETLLDLRPLRDPSVRVFGEPAPLGEWFARLLHGSLVVTVTDTYEDFGTKLWMAWPRRGRQLSDEDREAILGTMGWLPPHPEVLAALTRLRSADFPLATLTNSSQKMVRGQLEHAGLAGLFEEVLSVEEIRRFKPAPEPYLRAADRSSRTPTRAGTATKWKVLPACAAATEAIIASGLRMLAAM